MQDICSTLAHVICVQILINFLMKKENLQIFICLWLGIVCVCDGENERAYNPWFWYWFLHVFQSESPSRKRRKTSNSYIDLTNHSPSPPPTWSRESTEAARLGVSRRRVSSQRRISGDGRRSVSERSNTPRARRRYCQYVVLFFTVNNVSLGN